MGIGVTCQLGEEAGIVGISLRSTTLTQVGRWREQVSCLTAWLEVEERSRHWLRMVAARRQEGNRRPMAVREDGGKSGGILGTSQGRHGCLMWAREDRKEAG